MKILLLSDANSIHTIRWVKALSERGLIVSLWSLTAPEDGIYTDNIILGHANIEQKRKGFFGKLKYLTAINKLIRFIKEIKPDILHAHFASSYGLLGNLAGFQPYVISVWGADIFDFPNQNIFFKYIIRKNLERASLVLSTSHIMAKEAAKHTKSRISVTPFGIDLQKFNRDLFQRISSESDKFTIGTIKTLEDKYGLSYLIRGFAEFRRRYPEGHFRLLIVGGGSKEAELKNLAKELRIDKETTFTGFISHIEIPSYHAELDIAVFPSILDSESFGVSAVEASAMGTPVIASDVGGLPEVIRDGINGIIIPPKSSTAIANAIEKLYLNPVLREEMSQNGTKIARNEYDWERNVSQMIEIYESIFLNK